MLNSSQEKNTPTVKGLYIMAFTPEELKPKILKYVAQAADGMLRAKNPAFKQIMEERMAPKTRIEITNMQYIPLMHTPQGMQTTLMGWLKKKYNVTFKPMLEKNFFPHGIRDPQGKENFILFYFDLEGEDKLEVLPDYQKWRDFIFSVPAEQVDVSSNQPDTVYGVVLDVGLADEKGNPVDTNAVVTETAFASGESSVRTSFGGGLVGLGSHREIAEHAKQIVRLAQPLINITKPVNHHNLPVSGKIYFYFLTTSGVRFYECRYMEIYAQKHPFKEIFAQFSMIKQQADELKTKH